MLIKKYANSYLDSSIQQDFLQPGCPLVFNFQSKNKSDSVYVDQESNNNEIKKKIISLCPLCPFKKQSFLPASHLHTRFHPLEERFAEVPRAEGAVPRRRRMRGRAFGGPKSEAFFIQRPPKEKTTQLSSNWDALQWACNVLIKNRSRSGLYRPKTTHRWILKLFFRSSCAKDVFDSIRLTEKYITYLNNFFIQKTGFKYCLLKVTTKQQKNTVDANAQKCSSYVEKVNATQLKQSKNSAFLNGTLHVCDVDQKVHFANILLSIDAVQSKSAFFSHACHTELKQISGEVKKSYAFCGTAYTKYEVRRNHCTSTEKKKALNYSYNFIMRNIIFRQQIIKAVQRLTFFSNIRKVPASTKIFTVIRSPFVFKKTREQFGIPKNSYYNTIKINSKMHAHLLLNLLGTLKLPAELKVMCTY